MFCDTPLVGTEWCKEQLRFWAVQHLNVFPTVGISPTLVLVRGRPHLLPRRQKKIPELLAFPVLQCFQCTNPPSSPNSPDRLAWTLNLEPGRKDTWRFHSGGSGRDGDLAQL